MYIAPQAWGKQRNISFLCLPAGLETACCLKKKGHKEGIISETIRGIPGSSCIPKAWTNRWNVSSPLLQITKMAQKYQAISAWLPRYVEKYDLLGERYQAVAYLLSLSSREECGSSALAGGERELNKSVHAGEQKKGTRDTSGEVLWGALAKFMEYSRVCELRKSEFVQCALTKRRLLLFQSDPSHLFPH